ELAELAPRDVVAKAIYRVMRTEGTDHVALDARHLGKDFLERRFPTIVASCRAARVDPATDLIPVSPTPHFASRRARTDRSGPSSIPGLYACGEPACTGVHGANRLASNSLLEGLVFARRIAVDVARDLPAQSDPVSEKVDGWAVDAAIRAPLQATMSRNAGVLRSAASLAAAVVDLGRLGDRHGPANLAAWEATNLVTVASALVAAASRREETRGCHWREGFAEASDAFRGHFLARIDDEGRLTEVFRGATA